MVFVAKLLLNIVFAVGVVFPLLWSSQTRSQLQVKVLVVFIVVVVIVVVGVVVLLVRPGQLLPTGAPYWSWGFW